MQISLPYSTCSFAIILLALLKFETLSLNLQNLAQSLKGDDSDR